VQMWHLLPFALTTIWRYPAKYYGNVGPLNCGVTSYHVTDHIVMQIYSGPNTKWTWCITVVHKHTHTHTHTRIKTKPTESGNVKATVYRKVSFWLFSELSWVRREDIQRVPCRRCVRERTRVCAQPQPCEVGRRCRAKTGTRTASNNGFDNVRQMRWARACRRRQECAPDTAQLTRQRRLLGASATGASMESFSVEHFKTPFLEIGSWVTYKFRLGLLIGVLL